VFFRIGSSVFSIESKPASLRPVPHQEGEHDEEACFVNFNMKEFMKDAFMSYGISADRVDTCAEVLVEADLRGIDSHGLDRLKPIYCDRMALRMLWAPSAEAFLQPSLSRSAQVACRFHATESSSRRIPSSFLRMSESDDTSENQQEGEEEPIVKSVVKFGKGDADLTDRFKYKVHALMGDYTPQDGADDERQEGNILNGESEDWRLFVLRESTPAAFA
jgi:hypothetical protein